MVTVIKKGTPKAEIRKKMDTVLARGRNNSILKYAGTLKTDIDPLTYQKDLRNEWE